MNRKITELALKTISKILDHQNSVDYFLSEQKDCIILKKITFEANDSRTNPSRD